MRYLTTLLFAALSLNAVGQIEWDFPYNPDADNDAFVSSTDLLELLAIYGQEFSSDELYLSQDSTSLIVKIGHEMHQTECKSGCLNLEGNWRVATNIDVPYFYDFLSADLTAWYQEDDISLEDYTGMEYMWIGNSDIGANLNSVLKNEEWNDNPNGISLMYTPFTHHIGATSLPQGNECECWCVTHQRPKVEWHRIENNDFESNKDELSQNGWRLHTIDSGDGKYLFWRWAE